MFFATSSNSGLCDMSVDPASGGASGHVASAAARQAKFLTQNTMAKNIISAVYLYIAIFSLVVIEIFCAKLAFETLGEITSTLYFFIIAINIIPLLLLTFNKQKHLAIGIILLIGFIIVPYQFYLGNKLISLKEEAANITAYLYEQKIANILYPKDISGYAFVFPELKKNFNYNQESANQFRLYYYVGTESTSHFYKSDTKKWDYYPD